MKMPEIKKMSDKDLEKHVQEKREALRDFRFGVAGTKIRNIKEGRNLKRIIARLLTERNARTTK